MIKFSVQDTGIGIPKDKIDKLFASFTQVDASITRKYGGTGLGLAISKQLVELMGGEIGVNSKENQGTEFWFNLNFIKSDHSKPDHEDDKIPNIDVSLTKVLIVDDNNTFRKVLLSRLRYLGIMAVAVEDAEFALEEMNNAVNTSQPFLAAFIDMHMPVMSGVELAKVIKSDKNLKKTKLISMTSLGKKGDARKMEEAGFAAYLIKPIRKKDLLNTLKVILDRISRPEKNNLENTIVTRHSIRDMEKKNFKILVAEDNMVNQLVARKMLNKLGYRTDIVDNGVKAVKAIQETAYDLVFMDIQMPEMDGITATRKIRRQGIENDSVSKLTIIAMTANVLGKDKEDCLKAGMDDYLPKPITPESLSKVLEKWLPAE